MSGGVGTAQERPTVVKGVLCLRSVKCLAPASNVPLAFVQHRGSSCFCRSALIVQHRVSSCWLMQECLDCALAVSGGVLSC
jgi:hypothetical protein